MNKVHVLIENYMNTSTGNSKTKYMQPMNSRSQNKGPPPPFNLLMNLSSPSSLGIINHLKNQFLKH